MLERIRGLSLSWYWLGAMILLTAILGVLQYRWIGEVSEAERIRLRAGLQGSLYRLAQDWTAEIGAAGALWMPAVSAPSAQEREQAYLRQFAIMKQDGPHAGIFRRAARVTPREGSQLEFAWLDTAAGRFVNAEWPAEWPQLRKRLESRMRMRMQNKGDRGPRGFERLPEGEALLLDLPRFEYGPHGPQELEWLILELDAGYLTRELLPELLERHLGRGAQYSVEIITRGPAPKLFYTTGSNTSPRPEREFDVTAELHDVPIDVLLRRNEGRPMRVVRAREGPGRWQIRLRHPEGSLDAVVTRLRWRNLAVAMGLLALMIAATIALLRFTVRAQRLARLQMDFVAGVSHELRTPLTVMRTAGHNLGRGVVRDPAQVSRYGNLIRDEAERLTAIVEQILQFAAAKAGRVIRATEPVPVAALVEDVRASGAQLLDPASCRLEVEIAPGLPPVLADPTAVKHALQNLLTNAVKYGSEGGWIGIRAEAGANRTVRITVADRGPGIPSDELPHIFDPFYRGKQAVIDQIHGTGLGLSLVQKIVEAHGGRVAVQSRPGVSTEFTLVLPAAEETLVDEFAHSAR